MQAFEWKPGTGRPASGSFTDPGNWNDGTGAPGTTDQAQLNDSGIGAYTVTVSDPAAVDNLIQSYAGATLAITGSLALDEAGVGLVVEHGLVSLGASGVLTSAAQVQIGTGGTGGTVTLAGGAQATAGSTVLDGTGRLTVGGAWHDTGGGLLSDSLTMGGTSSVDVVGGTVTDDGSVGLAIGTGDATATTVEAGGAWTVAGVLAVGVAGTATLAVTGTSEVTAGTGLAAGLSALQLGVSAGSVGVLTLGAGSSLTVDGAAVVGVAGTGTLTVGAGAVAEVGDALVAGASATGTGAVFVGGSLDVAQSLQLDAGTFQSSGTVTVGTALVVGGTATVNGGSFTAQYTQLTGTGSLLVQQATLTDTGDGTITDASLSLAGSSSMELFADDFEGGAVVLAGSTSDNVTYTMEGGSQLLAAGALIVGQAGTASLAGSGGQDIFVTVGTSLTTADVGLALGVGAGSQGTLTLSSFSGAGNLTNQTSQTQVGIDGAGVLEMGFHGRATLGSATSDATSSTALAAGVSVDGSGQVTVTEGASLAVDGAAIIGAAGFGTLFVAGVADVSHGSLVLGQSDGSLGIATVVAGGTLNAESVVVGQAGAGTLDLSGGTVSATGEVVLGGSASGSGVATVGAGSTLSATGVVTVGEDGSGSLDIVSGLVQVGSLVQLGAGFGTGSVTVEAGGTLADAGPLLIGATTGGTVAVIGGGLVKLGGSGALQGNIFLGNGLDSQGLLTISGAGSRVVTTDSVFDAYANGSTGSINVNGGTLDLTGSTSELVIGNTLGSTGVLTVSNGGQVTAGDIYLGDQDNGGVQGSGSLDVESGGTVSGLLIIGTHSQATVGDGLLTSAGSLFVQGSLAISGTGVATSFAGLGLQGGTVSVTGSGELVLDDGTAQAGKIVIGGIDSSEGVGTLNAAIFVQSQGKLAAGVAGEQLPSTDLLTVTGSLDGSGDVDVLAGATLDVQSGAGSALSFSLDGSTSTLKIDAASAFAATITQMNFGDTIDLGSVGAQSASYDAVGQIAHIFDAAGTEVATLHLADNGDVALAGGLQVSTTGDVTLACFVTGTHIAAACGPVPVETLQAGEAIRTASGALRPVRWVGHRYLRQPTPDLAPIRIAAGAFGPGVPVRALLLSPDHAVLCGEVLVPVKALVNGATIAPCPVDRVTYWHVELDSHDVLLAEGLACESYLDTGNRDSFAGSVTALRPRFAAPADAVACRPIETAGARVTAAKAALLARAEALGHAWTEGSALHALADGRAVWPVAEGDALRFALPEAASLRLVSRHCVAAETDPGSSDPRRLGVAVSGMWVDGQEVDLDDPALGAGWHAAEAGWRWTDGDAAIAIPGVQELVLRLVPTALRYPVPPVEERARIC